MEKLFPKTINALESIFDFISGTIQEYVKNREVLLDINLAVEEVFTNIVRHAQGGGKNVKISVEIVNDWVEVSLFDFDVDIFDPLKYDSSEPTKPDHEKKPGGLGVHLVKKLMDDIKYEYYDRISKITLIKKLG